MIHPHLQIQTKRQMKTHAYTLQITYFLLLIWDGISDKCDFFFLSQNIWLVVILIQNIDQNN